MRRVYGERSDAPDIAVVIPVFNGERFIGDALDSVRSQTEAASEVVVVDDGSTDGTLREAEQIAREWPALQMVHQENRGVSTARNVGVAHTSAPLIAFLDADDQMVPTRLAAQRAIMMAHPKTGVVIGQVQDELDEGAPAPAWQPLRPISGRYLAIMTMMIWRTTWDGVGFFPPELHASEDLDWLSRAMAAGVPIHYLDEVVNRRRLHGANASQDFSPDVERADMFKILRRRLADRRRGTAPGGAKP